MEDLWKEKGRHRLSSFSMYCISRSKEFFVIFALDS